MAIEAARLYNWQTVAPSYLDLYQELHRKNADQAGGTAAAFTSSPAYGFHAALMRGVAHVARRSFSLWSKRGANRSSYPSVISAALEADHSSGD